MYFCVFFAQNKLNALSLNFVGKGTSVDSYFRRTVVFLFCELYIRETAHFWVEFQGIIMFGANIDRYVIAKVIFHTIFLFFNLGKHLVCHSTQTKLFIYRKYEVILTEHNKYFNIHRGFVYY